MKTDRRKRFMYYFIRQAEVSMLQVAGGGLIIAAYIWFLNMDGSGLREIVSYVPAAIMYMSMLVLFINGISFNHYSLLISFGCRRIDAFAGNLIRDLLFIMQNIVVYSLTLSWVPKDDFYIDSWVILTGYLVLEGTAKLLGIAAVKWGKMAYILMTVIIVTICMFLGFWAGYAAGHGEVIPFAAAITGDKRWKVLSGGILICVLTNLAAYRMFRKFEVKA